MARIIAIQYAKRLPLLAQVASITNRFQPTMRMGKLNFKNASFCSKRLLSSKATFKFQETLPPERIASFEVDYTSEMLNLTLSTSETRQYPFIWLYDNCHCDACFNRLVCFRTQTFSTWESDVKPTSVNKTENGLEIRWNNDHVSLYPHTWLASHTFPASVSDKVLPWWKMVRRWDNKIEKDISEYKYNDVIEDDDVLYKFIDTIKVDGIALIPDAGFNEDTLERLARRIGYPIPNNYGPVFKIDNLRPPSEEPWIEPQLALHTDIALDQVGEVLFLHTIQHVEGGGFHELVDGINAAYQLRDQDPEAFDILCSTNIMNSYIDTKDISLYRSFNPTIKLNDENMIVGIHYSNHTRDAELPLPAASVKRFLLALRKFHEIISHPNNVVNRHTIGGEIICLNNNRCLHGRTSYVVEPGKKNNRLVKGCYLSWQDAYSKQRVINGMREKFVDGKEKV